MFFLRCLQRYFLVGLCLEHQRYVPSRAQRNWRNSRWHSDLTLRSFSCWKEGIGALLDKRGQDLGSEDWSSGEEVNRTANDYTRAP